jgi:hypothetical protein
LARVAAATVILFGLAGPAQAAISYVQSFTGASAATGSVSVTTNAATTSGNLLVALVSITAPTDITVTTVPTATAATGFNNTWTFITSNVQNSGTRCSIRLYYIQNAAAQPSGTLQTWTLSGNPTAATVTISEYSGAKTSAALADFGSVRSGATTSQLTGAATSVAADVNGMWIAAVNKASNVTFSSVNDGYTLRAGSQATSGTFLSHIMLDRPATIANETLTNTAVTIAAGSFIGSGAVAIFQPAPITTKYWIGNGSNTDCTAGSNWSTSSGGAASGVAPTSTTDVHFDGNRTGSCTMGTATTWGSLTIASGYTGTITVSANLTLGDATKVATVAGGTIAAGAATLTFNGGLSVSGSAVLDLTSTGTIAIGSGKALTIDGTLKATGPSTIPTIQVASSGSYSFNVGSTGTATPVLNIDGLNVRNTAANGMYINTVSGSSTTFTRFDNIAFSSGTGTQLLRISAATLYLTSSGCTFDAGVATGTTTFAVTLTGNGSTGTPDATETRAFFGATTCADNWTLGASDRSCLNLAAGTGTTAKSDDDADGNGVGNTPASNGAVVAFVRATGTDTAGTIVGFPTAAFDWNTFAYYSTYATYNDASGTSAIVYVRNGAGIAQYSWTAPAGETIVGTPRWTTSGSTHYLYVALASGKVYRLIDDTVSKTLTPDTTGNWAGANNPFSCSCTIVTPLAINASNLYWGGTSAGPTQQIWTLGQSSRAQPSGSPITITPAITSAAPALWLDGATANLFIGVTGHIIRLNVTNQVLSATNDSPGAASVWGRIATNSVNRIFAGDDGGNMWAIDPANFSGTNKAWSYLVSGDAIKSSAYYEQTTGIIHFGTEGGKVVALDSSGTPLTGYPYTPGAASDAIRSALFSAGVLVVGTTTGKLFFLDRRTGSGPALIRLHSFGPTELVSGISYDSNTNRYMVSTSDSSAKDGRLYYIDVISDPTPASP